MNNKEMINELQGVLTILPSLQMPAAKINLQILLAATESIEKIVNALKEQETEEDEELAVTMEEI